MKLNRIIGSIIAAALAICSSVALAEPEVIINEIGFIGTGLDTATARFELSNSGRYEIAIKDMYNEEDETNIYLQPFTQLKFLLLKDGHKYIESMQNAGKTLPLDLESGTYQVYIAGSSEQTSEKISQYYFSITAESEIANNYPQPTYEKIGFLPEVQKIEEVENGSTIPVGIEEDGDYKVYLTNFSFPNKLSTLKLLIANNDTPESSIKLNASEQTQDVSPIFSAKAGQLLTLATIAIADDAEGKGLYGIKLVKMSGNVELTVLEAAIPVGTEDGEINIDAYTTYNDTFTVGNSTTQTLHFSMLNDQLDAARGIFASSVAEDVGEEDTEGAEETEGEPEPEIETLPYTIMITNTTNNQVVFNQNATTEETELNLASGTYAIAVFSQIMPGSDTIFGIRITAGDKHIYDHTLAIGGDFILSEKLPQVSSQSEITIADMCEGRRFDELGAVITNGTDIIDYISVDYPAAAPAYCSTPYQLNQTIETDPALQYQVHLLSVLPTPANGEVARPAMYYFKAADKQTGEELLELTGALQGDYFNSGYEFEIATAGNATIKLTDYQFPEEFNELKIVVTHGTEKETIYSSDPEGTTYTYTSDKLQSGKYYATIMANLQSENDIGTYGIVATFTPEAASQTEEGSSEPTTDDGNNSGGGGSIPLSLIITFISLVIFARKRTYR